MNSTNMHVLEAQVGVFRFFYCFCCSEKYMFLASPLLYVHFNKRALTSGTGEAGKTLMKLLPTG